MGGWGARSYKNLVLVYDEKLFDEKKKSRFAFEAGAEVAAGTLGVDGGSGGLLNKKIDSFMLLDGGGSATATIRVLRLSEYSDLNN